MAEFYTLLTEKGRNKLANAQALGTTVSFTDFAVGDGGGAIYNPADTQTALANEVYRAGINQLYTDTDNPSWLVTEAVIPETEGGWYIREAGVFDSDGDMIAIAKYPETYKPVLSAGSGKDLYMRLVLEYSNTGEVVLKVDPAIVLATRKYVDDEIAEHESVFNATTVQRGHVELATQAETDAGTDNVRAVTPAVLSGRVATETQRGLIEIATVAEAKALADFFRSITPGTLSEVLSHLTTGQVAYFAMQTPPTGWLVCNGSSVSRTTYDALFAAVGTAFGPGDGSTTFTLPDLRGEFLRGWDGGRGIDGGRAFGTYQRGSYLPGDDGVLDTFVSVYRSSQKGFLGWDSWGISTENTGDTVRSFTNTNTVSNLGQASWPAHGGMARPRNVALLPCIRY